ncbi:fumarylacetoacetate hydrolase family protein [Psychrobium sp. 1_MG-2023]|uniref:fumarylacetoacetate hydrolase family protein n=1 Tax=Psychrobium sp. 1_MG-2023 TaxID=3062624 RepID=UPI000C32CCEF|nr:fumarylacetoacetate hydrolase family protein [Psychrobium sp. 1_MG-2023]MDP2559667.1 fumarylacetoacetate hydrolase family protein [Psychrobium sp. 1_MG-2023]PKF59498.1 2-keto-4-pentenoate hydratase [Alteromonadales bacterium alter-6D02]
MNRIETLGKLISPNKVICIGRNYVEHITELGNEIPDDMVVFIKPNSSISQQLISFHQEELHYEGEICFVYNQGRFDSVGFGLDLTKRKLQGYLKSKGLPWERAKAFDGSAVFSSFVALEQGIEELTLELSIDGVLTQQGGVSLMMYKPAQILENIQQFMTLVDGDIVMTGTPKGVGVVTKGASFHGKIKQAGQLLIEQQWIAS